MKALLGSILCTPFVIWLCLRIYLGITFNIDCDGHMERAGSANSIDLARQEMEVVVKYAEGHGMTSGYTSIFYNTPDEDVGFWYQNMKASLDELHKVTSETSELEKSNMLIKLRESLLHHTSGSAGVTIPEGISIFPHNVGYFWLCIVGCVLGLVSMVLIWLQIVED